MVGLRGRFALWPPGDRCLKSNNMKKLALTLLLCASQAQAACLPPISPQTLMPAMVTSDNPRGCWAGWKCPDGTLYIAAATARYCGLVGPKRLVAAWVTNPDASILTFGQNPHTDPVLRAVWEPERAKLDALK